MTLAQVHHILVTAERIGSENDKPEGSRYIQISDTLAKHMADAILLALGLMQVGAA